MLCIGWKVSVVDTNDSIWTYADTVISSPEAFSRILGIKPAFMRPPYGNYNDNVREIAYARNQSRASWNHPYCPLIDANNSS